MLIRVSPGVDPHTHVHTTTGILDSKFGFAIQTGHAAESVRQTLAAPNLNLLGLHFHLGSPIFELEPYAVATEVVLRFAADLRKAPGSRKTPGSDVQGLEMQEFSPGGGFAIAYTRDQEPPAIGDYADTIVSALKSNCDALGLPAPRMIIEPGRSIIGPAGVAIYRIGAIKDIPGVRKYVSVDGGMGDNIRPALYQAVYEVVVANKAGQDPSETVTIAGKYCESGDLLASDITLPEVEPGDVLAIPAAGAYCPVNGQQLQPQPQAAHRPGQGRPKQAHPPPRKLPGHDDCGRGLSRAASC